MINFDEFDIEEKDKDISIGDTVEILPCIEDYIRKFEWPDRMRYFIGKSFVVIDIVVIGIYVNEECVSIKDSQKSEWYIPIKCVKKL